jgi:hypothetical protein
MNRFHALAMARASLPRLTLAQRVVDRIVRNALTYETETGEALVGVAIKPFGRVEPDLYVLETIAPDDSPAQGDTAPDRPVRERYAFVQGDDLQMDIFNWWYDNWQQFRERRRGSYGNAVGAKWDSPLAHLGDWHKHPGMMVEPSGGDFETAYRHVMDREHGAPELVILATVWDRAQAEQDTTVDPQDAVGQRGQTTSLSRSKFGGWQHAGPADCWYISRRTRRFVRLAQMVAEDKIMPALPVVGWHLGDFRLNEEVKALNNAGYFPSVEICDADQVPPLEICLPMARRDGQHILIAITQADYPATKPTFRVAPLSAAQGVPEGKKRFEAIWQASQPLPTEAYAAPWTPESRLVDLVKAVEPYLEQHPVEGSKTP